LDARELEGRLLVELDRIDEARTVLEAAGRTAWEVGMEPMVWRLLALKGEALERSGDSAAAKSAFSEASAVIRRIAGSIDDPELNRGFLESPAVTRVTGRGS
jgi:predicted negative regulator of RcsB-dependent stress response